MESAVAHREHRSRSAWRATQSQVSSASHPVTVASTLTFAARTARCSSMKRRIRIHWSASLSASGPWIGSTRLTGRRRRRDRRSTPARFARRTTDAPQVTSRRGAVPDLRDRGGRLQIDPVTRGGGSRRGRIRLERIPNIKKPTTHDFVRRNIADEADAIYTDELASHVGVETPTRKLETVNHNAEEWVVGDVHTNSVEGVWSLFKRSIRRGVPQDERQAQRFNNRGNPYIFRDALRRIMHTDPLEYRTLIAD